MKKRIASLAIILAAGGEGSTFSITGIGLAPSEE